MILAQTLELPNVILIVFFCYLTKCVIDGIQNPEKHAFKKDIDKFDIGYIDPSTPTVYHNEVNIKPQKSKKKKKTNKKDKPIITKESQLKKECVSALVSLGYQKRQANQSVNDFFETNIVTNTEEFLQQFFRK